MSKILRNPNGNFKKGHSPNPGGRKGTEFGNWLRNHPKTKIAMSLILEHACNKDSDYHMECLKIVSNKVAPNLRATNIKVQESSNVPIIMLPNVKEEGAIVDPISIDNIEAKA